MSLRNCLVGSVAAILLGAGVAAIAQEATTNPSGESSHVRVPTPYNRLQDLTDDQQSKIKDIHSEIMDEEKQIRQKEHDEIDAVLTDDQKKELADIEAKSTLERKASEEARRAKEEEEKAQNLKTQADGTATTQPSGGGQ